MLKKSGVLNLWALLFFFTTNLLAADQADSSCNIHFNGNPTRVYFNDGDTFKILEGPFKGSRVRIEGFNTLESYGPVHSWLDATGSYLFQIANQATMHAREGGWSCKAKRARDTYGRLLAVCDDLALSFMEKGLAHTFTMNKKPGKSEYLAAQKRSQKKKLGMWKYGVPDHIVTSLHSISENKNDKNKLRKAYNRLISTDDGHSEKWIHSDAYDTCQNICLDNEDSCMIYVPYYIRYGKNRPSCLLD